MDRKAKLQEETLNKNQEDNDKTEIVTGFMRAEEMAKKAQGIKRVGYLRMDVDNLGKMFATGLKR